MTVLDLGVISMKKIICVILIVVLCLNLSGCLKDNNIFNNISKGEQNAMLMHLEEKYNERFVVKELLVPEYNISSLRGAYVYPEGKGDEVFFVEIASKGRYIDEYVLYEPEKRMLPIYEEWVQNVIPSAKVRIKLNINHIYNSKEIKYNPNETLEQFISQANGIDIDINIILCQDVLEEKDKIFEKLSKLPESEPVIGYLSCNYNIGFLEKEVFENINMDKYEHIPNHLYSAENNTLGNTADNFVAVTSFIRTYDKDIEEQWDFLEQLNRNFQKKEEYIIE